MKTPAGLTCAQCGEQFGGTRPARKTDDGWAHTERCWSLPVLAEAYGQWVRDRHGIMRWRTDPDVAADWVA